MKKFIFLLKRQTAGIGLLELMLTLAVLSVMLIVAVRYYSSANSEQEASSLVNSYSTIKAAVENYLADNPNQAVTNTMMTTLVQSGYLPSAYGATVKGKTTPAPNQWGGAISVGPSSSGSTFYVTQANIPKSVCMMTVGQLLATVNSTLGECVIVSPKPIANPGTCKTIASPKMCSAASAISVIYVA